jgi:hypothetical protein
MYTEIYRNTTFIHSISVFINGNGRIVFLNCLRAESGAQCLAPYISSAQSSVCARSVLSVTYI